MDIMFVLIPISIVLAVAGCIAFRWALRSGQFDDTKTPSMRMVFDEDETPARGDGGSGPTESD